VASWWPEGEHRGNSQRSDATVSTGHTMINLGRRRFRHVLEHDGAPIDDVRLNAAVQLALIAEHHERIGDHAATIAEQVHFVATGEHSRIARFRR